MDDTLDAEVGTEELVEAIQAAADALCARGYLPGALVALASPRTIRDRKLVLRLGHLLPVVEAKVDPGGVIVLPLNDATEYLRNEKGGEN